jgi:hypothetical protein
MDSLGDERFRKLSIRDRVLITLLEGEMHFSPLLKKVGCSRGPLNTQLRILRTEKPPLVEYGSHDEDYNNCCPSRLTIDGEREAKNIHYIRVFDTLPYDTKERIISSYKNKVLSHLKDIANKPAERRIYVASPLAKKHGAPERRSVMVGGEFSIPEPKEQDKLSQIARITYSEQRKIAIKAVEDVLRTYGFAEDEILRMWLGNGHLIAEVLRFRTKGFGKDYSQDEIETMRRRIQQSLRIPNPLI